MCGYCIERRVVLDFVEYEKSYKNEYLENYWISIYVQESTDFPAVLRRLKTFSNFPGSIDIAFCRLWETFLYQGNNDTYNSFVDVYGSKETNDFLVGLKNNLHNEKWRILGDSELYINKDCWAQFLSNINQLIESSESTLKSYLNFWIVGKNKEVSNPEKRMEETGIIDPIENTTAKDWDKFYSLFPVVYFSFLIIEHYKTDSKILKRIALGNPHDVPDFLGYDLWLQRKAFTVCVKNYGVQFILNNYDDIRLELIYYCLLKKSICVTDLNVLKNHLLSQEHWDQGVDSDLVVELINNLQAKA